MMLHGHFTEGSLTNLGGREEFKVLQDYSTLFTAVNGKFAVTYLDRMVYVSRQTDSGHRSIHEHWSATHP